MADIFIKREVDITVNGNTASLSEPIYLYPNDRNINIYFTIKDVGYKFGSASGTTYADNATYARVKYIKEDKTTSGVSSPTILPIEDSKVVLTIDDDFMCQGCIDQTEHEEILPGVYLLQILLYDEECNGRITIPPVRFEILEPIFQDEPDENGILSIDNPTIINPKVDD